jgi:CBS domain containing-hemolysin-like protein
MKDNEWIVLGKTDIENVNARIGMNIPDSSDYDTFSGYILGAIGRIPHEGEKIAIGNYLVTVKRKEGVRITEYIVKKAKTTELKKAETIGK